jgi:hypothetical protein
VAWRCYLRTRRISFPGLSSAAPLDGDVPTIDLVIGYSKANTSPILKLFLSRLDELIARVSKKFGGPVDSSEGNAR